MTLDTLERLYNELNGWIERAEEEPVEFGEIDSLLREIRAEFYDEIGELEITSQL